MQARYTAVDGGATLRNTVISAVKKKLAGVQGSTMYALIDVKHEFPNEWFMMTRMALAVPKNKGQPSPPDTKASAVRLSLPQLNTKFPFWTTGKNLIATLTSIIISHPDTAVAPALSWAESSAKGAFKATEILGRRHTLLQDTVARPVGDWAFGIPTVDGKVMVDGLYVIIEYRVDKF